MDRETRLLLHNKAFVPKIVRRKPNVAEGFEGEMSIGNTPDGIKLFIKVGHAWHTWTPEITNVLTRTSIIKIPATDFLNNDDSGTASGTSIEDDTATFGVISNTAAGELYAYVDVPKGYRARKVKITGNDSGNDVAVFTVNLDDGGISTEISNTGLEVNDDIDLSKFHVGADDNMLLITVIVEAITDIIFGGYVTIEKI